MNRHEARLEIVWQRAVEALAELDEADAGTWGDQPEVFAAACSALESILILSRSEDPTPSRSARGGASTAVLTGLEVPLDLEG